VFYAGALLLMIYLLYSQGIGNLWLERNSKYSPYSPTDYAPSKLPISGRSSIFDPLSVPPAFLSKLAEEFFVKFLLVQLAAVVLLTPACTAPALAEEKERRTLEFLFTTHVGSLELVLAKFVSRVAFLALIVLTGLPILSFLQLLGGVDPNRV